MQPIDAAASAFALVIALAALPVAAQDQGQTETRDTEPAAGLPPGPTERQPTAAAPEISVEQIAGRTIVSQTGERIGKLDNVVRDPQDNSLHAVVSVGGFLGIGEKDVTLPVDRLSLHGDRLMAPPEMGEAELANREEYQASRFQELPPNETVSLAGAGEAGQGQGRTAGYGTDRDAAQGAARSQAQQGQDQGQRDFPNFNQLDRDSDGFLDKSDVEDYRALADNFERMDTDGNTRLDQAEFAAIEEARDIFSRPRGGM